MKLEQKLYGEDIEITIRASAYGQNEAMDIIKLIDCVVRMAEAVFKIATHEHEAYRTVDDPQIIFGIRIGVLNFRCRIFSTDAEYLTQMFSFFEKVQAVVTRMPGDAHS